MVIFTARPGVKISFKARDSELYHLNFLFKYYCKENEKRNP